MTGGGPQLFQKRLRRFVEETLLTLIADLNHSYVGEASLPIRTDRLDQATVDIGPLSWFVRST